MKLFTYWEHSGIDLGCTNHLLVLRLLLDSLDSLDETWKNTFIIWFLSSYVEIALFLASYIQILGVDQLSLILNTIERRKCHIILYVCQGTLFTANIVNICFHRNKHTVTLRTITICLFIFTYTLLTKYRFSQLYGHADKASG